MHFKWQPLSIVVHTFAGYNFVESSASLNSEIAEGLCENLRSYEATKKTSGGRLLRENVTPKLPQAWMTWESCNYVVITLKDQFECSPQIIPCVNPSKCPPKTREVLLPKDLLNSLKTHARKTQGPILDLLSVKGRQAGSTLTVVDSLWITNEIVVKGSSLPDLQNLLRGRNEILSVRPQRVYKLATATTQAPIRKSKNGDYTPYPGYDFRPWGIVHIDAIKVWEKGINGTGVVVAHIDSGVDGTHEALRDNFIGGDYGWFDPFLHSPTPHDPHGHGTHVMGTMVGTTQTIGVAPGAKWMSCLGCDVEGDCCEVFVKKCGQWILAPTKTDGTEPDSRKAPHIVSSSWGEIQPQEGTNGTVWMDYEPMLKCWREAGIIPVFAIGNNGPHCGTAAYPGISDQVIGVGNVERGGSQQGIKSIPQFGTSKGPAIALFNKRIKPDVSAPGSNILSSIPGGYNSFTGTSMAAPHVAGTIALMLQKNPSLEYDEIFNALIKSCGPTFPPREKYDCGGINETMFPNYAAGHGVINAYRAVFGTDL